MDIKDLITDKVTAVLDAKLDEIVTKNIEKAIETIFHETFSGYGSSNKELKQSIEQSIQLGLKKVKIDAYQDRVLAVVQEQIGKYLDEKANLILSERIKSTCQILQKTDWKFSEIVEVFVEENFPDEEEEFCPTITVQRSNYGYTHIYIDTEPHQENFNCRLHFMLDKNGTVVNYQILDSLHRSKQRGIHTSNSKTDQLLFALYANGATVEIDEYETEFYREQD